MTFKHFVGLFLPSGIVEMRRNRLREKKRKGALKENIALYEKIRDFLVNLDYGAQPPDVQEVVDYVKTHSIAVFPYYFPRKHSPADVRVFYDDKAQMAYCMHEGKRLYWPRGMSFSSIRSYYAGLLSEQDTESPHRYEADGFQVKDGDVIADVGAAEGIWALSNIEKASKAYLFECETRWLEALERTFEPWKNKVFLVNKYVSSVTEGSSARFDDIISGNSNRGGGGGNFENRVNFIKADIEGAEMNFLLGAEKTLLSQKDLKLLLCTYHRQNDFQNMKAFLEERGFRTEHSRGFMIFILDKNIAPPYIRRALLRAVRLP